MKGVSIFLIFLLSGCGCYNGCCDFITARYCVDKGKVFPYIASFQKPYSIGRTDSAQRWKDAYACGGVDEYDRRSEERDITVKKNGKLSSEDNADSLQTEFAKFRSCMKSKGYIMVANADCGTQKGKWNTGKCNI